MAKFGKWLAGGLGWAFFGPIGGIMGFALGSLIDNTTIKTGAHYKTTSGDFAASLIVLIAAVMKADGKVLKSELDYVKNYFIQVFGQEKAQDAILLLRDIIQKDIPVNEVTFQIRSHLDYSSRLQMLHLLFGVANSDGNFNINEANLIQDIATQLGINSKDFASIKAMFFKDVESSYKILEIHSDATEEEIKKAYRKMAIKYHPDKVAHLGEEVQVSANEKFQKLNEAYDRIKKERGFN